MGNLVATGSRKSIEQECAKRLGPSPDVAVRITCSLQPSKVPARKPTMNHPKLLGRPHKLHADGDSAGNSTWIIEQNFAITMNVACISISLGAT